jgi:phosphate transport system permease protein
LLVLSAGNHVSKAILGPGGNGDVAAEIAAQFPVSSGLGESELILAGLTLFATTLIFTLGGRLIARRSVGQA